MLGMGAFIFLGAPIIAFLYLYISNRFEEKYNRSNSLSSIQRALYRLTYISSMFLAGVICLAEIGAIVLGIISTVTYQTAGQNGVPDVIDLFFEEASAFETIDSGQTETTTMPIVKDADGQWVAKNGSSYFVSEKLDSNSSELRSLPAENTKIVEDATLGTARVDMVTVSGQTGTYLVTAGFTLCGLIEVEPEYATKQLSDTVSYVIHVPIGEFVLDMGS